MRASIRTSMNYRSRHPWMSFSLRVSASLRFKIGSVCLFDLCALLRPRLNAPCFMEAVETAIFADALSSTPHKSLCELNANMIYHT